MVEAETHRVKESTNYNSCSAMSHSPYLKERLEARRQKRPGSPVRNLEMLMEQSVTDETMLAEYEKRPCLNCQLSTCQICACKECKDGSCQLCVANWDLVQSQKQPPPPEPEDEITMAALMNQMKMMAMY